MRYFTLAIGVASRVDRGSAMVVQGRETAKDRAENGRKNRSTAPSFEASFKELERLLKTAVLSPKHTSMDQAKKCSLPLLCLVNCKVLVDRLHDEKRRIFFLTSLALSQSGSLFSSRNHFHHVTSSLFGKNTGFVPGSNACSSTTRAHGREVRARGGEHNLSTCL